MAAGKKPITQTDDVAVALYLDKMSKAALADLVVDLVRRSEGDEHLDGDALAAAIDRAAHPVFAVRGDKPPRYDPRFIVHEGGFYRVAHTREVDGGRWRLCPGDVDGSLGRVDGAAADAVRAAWRELHGGWQTTREDER
jgi:hypothetical protein